MQNKIKNFFRTLPGRIICIIWGLIIVLPLIWVLLQSFRSNQDFMMNPFGFPTHFRFKSYGKALNSLGLLNGFLNSLFYVGGSMLLGLTVSTICSYILSRMEWKGRKVIISIIMLSLFLPGLTVLVPQYTMMVSLHWNNSILGLIFLQGFTLAAQEVMILSAFMKNIHREIEESAFVDGATRWKTFLHIIVPLSRPGIVTIAIFKFIGLYNDFICPFIYLSDERKYPVSVSMYYANIRMQYNSDWSTLFAAIIIAIIPTIIVYLIFQKTIIEGATIGSVKG